VDGRVLGRFEATAQLEQFVEGLSAGPGSLVIEGEAGIGKTTLWRATVNGAGERGLHVLACRPAESETALAYSGLADLLAAVDRSALAILPAPQRHALEVALLLSDPTLRSPDPRAVFAAFGGIVRSLAGETPVLVAIDDLQWLDASSLWALEFTSRRLGDARVGILATARRPPDAGIMPRGLVPGAEVLRLDPLSPAAIHQLVKERVGLSLPRSTLLRLHRMTRGNPFFAIETARVLLASGLPGPSDSWPVPPDLRKAVAARVQRLPESARLSLLAIAAGAVLTVESLDEADLDAAAHAGMTAISTEGTVQLAHPLFASAIYQGATPRERRRVHAVLAESSDELEEMARHRALACVAADDDVASLLERAAARARSRGAPDIAAELAARSRQLTPSDRPEQAWARELMAAEHHCHAGDLEHARTLLNGLVTSSEPSVPRSRALRLLGEVCYRSRNADEALRHLRDAVDAAGDDVAFRARAELDLAFVLYSSFGSFQEGHECAVRALAAAENQPDEELLASALACCAHTELLLGFGLDDDKIDRALALEDVDRSSPLEGRPSLLAGSALLHAGEFARARAVLEGLRSRLVERGDESGLPDVLALLARLECREGNLVAASRIADEGYELALQLRSDSLVAGAAAARALVHAHAGRIEETRSAAAEAIERAARSEWRLAAFWASTALGLLEISLEHDQAVISTLAHSIDLVERHGLPEPSRCPFLPDAIEALVRLGELDRADRLTRLLEDRGRELGRLWAIVTGARCRALVLAGSGELVEAIAVLERAMPETLALPERLERARTLLVKGQLERRRKQRGRARDTLRDALVTCEEINAALWAQRVRADLARVGAVRARLELTATELRIATLAAQGMTNREIGAAAFVSEKTVEANLSRIYRKLSIRSRAELGVRLAMVEALPESG
jgi:DNA-binding CsgD family transcriptional regulator